MMFVPAGVALAALLLLGTSGPCGAFSRVVEVQSEDELVALARDACVLVGSSPADLGRLREISEAFYEDEGIHVALDVTRVVAESFEDHRTKYSAASATTSSPMSSGLYVIPRAPRARECLMTPVPKYPRPVPFTGHSTDFYSVLTFVNDECFAFRYPNGLLSEEGKVRSALLGSFYTAPPPVAVRTVHHEETGKQHLEKLLPTCETIAPPSWDVFLADYVAKSKPVVIRNAMDNWPALIKWSNAWLREQFGDTKAHIKMAPEGVYEGCEDMARWEGHEFFNIPDKVREQLPFPDLVVVRPASKVLRFSDFLDLITDPVEPGSAYLEYTNIREYFKELELDISVPDFASFLDLEHLNLWLSDGNTLGKLHFDPFENLLAMVSGTKTFTLFPPHENENLYEGHIQEAELEYNFTTRQFLRRTLQESTSMVMSPVDILNPDLERFPRFADANAINCTVQPGDMLYLPSFWWHEVQSTPDPREHRNLAVNLWFKPLFRKEFPCPSCRLDVNPEYRHLLSELARIQKRRDSPGPPPPTAGNEPEESHPHWGGTE